MAQSLDPSWTSVTSYPTAEVREVAQRLQPARGNRRVPGRDAMLALKSTTQAAEYWDSLACASRRNVWIGTRRVIPATVWIAM